MSTSAVTPPPGFELERGEHLAVTPPPGFELEDQASKGPIQLPPGFEPENQTSKDSIQLPPGFELEKSVPPAAPHRPSYGFSKGSSYVSSMSGTKSGQRNSTATQESRDFLGINKPAQTPSATPRYRSQKAQARPDELAAGERIWQGIQDDQVAKFDDLNAAFQPLTRQQATEGLWRESSEYKAATTGGRKPLNRREAALSGTTLPVDPAFDIAAPETSGVPPSLMRSYQGFQGAYGERHLSPVQYDRSTAVPLPEETLDEYTDRIDRIVDEGRPKWIKALRDARGTATQWGHDVAADAAELYLNINGIYREPHPTIVGIARSTAGFVGGMATDPTTYVLGGAGGIAGNAGRRLMATGFSIYASAGAYEQARQLREIWNRPDIPYEQKVEMSTGLALNAAMAGLSARHGLHSPRTIPLEKGFLDEISALGKNAKQDILSRLQEKFNAAVAEKLGERLQRQEPGARGSRSAIAQGSEKLQFKPGDYVMLPNGRGGTIQAVFPEMGVARVKPKNANALTIRLSDIKRHAQPRQRWNPADRPQFSLFSDDKPAAESQLNRRKNRMPSNDNPRLDHTRTRQNEDGSTTYYDRQGQSVTYSQEGFADFSPHSDFRFRVKVPGLTGDHLHDELLANKAAGLKSTPKGYTWHHVEDAETMQLVRKGPHDNFPHTGGASIIKSTRRRH